MIPSKGILSRDDRKLLNIERLFQKQEEEEKRKLMKQKKQIILEAPSVILPIVLASSWTLNRRTHVKIS